MSKKYVFLCLVFVFISGNLLAQEFKPDVEVFGNYTYDLSEGKKDLNSFNIGRTYLGFKGNFYKNEETKFSVNFRVTTDISELSDIAKKDKYEVKDNIANLSGSKYNGYYAEFLKYAYVELENPFLNGLKLVVGQHNVPWVGFEEGMSKTRWLTPVFSDKEKKLSSTDRGVSIIYKLPSDFGDLHFSVVNGEGYHSPETTKDKDLMVRLSVRPLPFMDIAKGLMLHGYYGYGRANIDGLNNDAEGVRKREILALSYDYKFVTLMGQYLRTLDGKDVDGETPFEGSGYSLWTRINLNSIFEINESGIFVRFDSFDPNTDKEKDAHNRIIIAPYYYVVNGKVAFALQFQNESYEDSNVKPIKQILFNMLAKY